MLPLRKPFVQPGKYDIYPVFPAGDHHIFIGAESLLPYFSRQSVILVDGYTGVYFDQIRENIHAAMKASGIEAEWISTLGLMKSPDVIEELVAPFLGGDDPLFGTRTNLSLPDFFDTKKLEIIRQKRSEKVTLIYGPGAALARNDGLLLYIDLPKNELQYRARAGNITNLGTDLRFSAKAMYKRFYFVDWIVLNRHKQDICHRIDFMIDGQQTDELIWMSGKHLRETLNRMSRSVFRVRPWFEPGAWGGTWIKDHIPGLISDVPNYAWSFEMIVPENGLILESNDRMLEISFDWLMYLEAEAVLGDCHSRFGTEFPIRFDFLDTFDGGNLSVQVHPREDYIRWHFGENFTQQEAYYILDTKNEAHVNLGFREDINPEIFRFELEKSESEKTEVDIPAYIQQLPASKHDFFLIPDGMVHGSGTNNIVLEISTTPYIFTFKMYDWLRPDLNGKPRDLNIARAFDNLCFDRKGEMIPQEFLSHPVLLAEGKDWKKYHLPTHPLHLYDVHRYHFNSEIEIETHNKCHVLNLVEGDAIRVETSAGVIMDFHYAETFVIPAAAGKYRVINLSGKESILVAAFMK
ncbi:MAG: class I mannose-6-phosphate isomerase [Bacteroidia bacterium]|nr:class I mannose-6-phosphate isomerase [Bacteroidia bacterium]